MLIYLVKTNISYVIFIRSFGRRELLLRFWRTKTLNQPLYLLSATATSHCGIGLFFNLSHCCSPIYDGIDNIHLKNLITDT